MLAAHMGHEKVQGRAAQEQVPADLEGMQEGVLHQGLEQRWPVGDFVRAAGGMVQSLVPCCHGARLGAFAKSRPPEGQVKKDSRWDRDDHLQQDQRDQHPRSVRVGEEDGYRLVGGRQ